VIYTVGTQELLAKGWRGTSGQMGEFHLQFFGNLFKCFDSGRGQSPILFEMI